MTHPFIKYDHTAIAFSSILPNISDLHVCHLLGLSRYMYMGWYYKLFQVSQSECPETNNKQLQKL